MATDQRPPRESRQLLSWPSRLVSRLAKALAVLALPLAAMLLAASLGASADGAAAMGFHGIGGFGSGLHRDAAYHGSIQGSRIETRTSRSDTPNWRRHDSRIVRVPPGEGTSHHPGRPHRPHPPVIGGFPLPPVSTGLIDPPPAGPIGPAAGGGAGGTPAGGDRRFVPDEILVNFAVNVPAQSIVGFAQGQRLALLGIHRLPLINTTLYRFRITDRRPVPAVLGSLRVDARIAAAQPNYLYTLQEVAQGELTGDPAQYVIGKLHLAQAHAFATGSHVLVAVIDSTIDVRHPELQDVVTGGFDAVGGVMQPHPHGTAMASAIAAHGRLLGAAPDAHLLAVRAFDGTSADAHSTTTRVLDGLQWAADSGARVVNMSFTGPADAKLHDMIAAARQKGLVLVAAAGNDGPQAAPDYPAAYPEVIAVTATDIDDRLLSVANHGAYLSVAAPGVDIFVAAPDGRYGFTTGTSVATAHVSGVAALLLERNPALTPDAVRAILMRTAKDLGPEGRDDAYGAGLVDAYEALLALTPATAQTMVTH